MDTGKMYTGPQQQGAPPPYGMAPPPPGPPPMVVPVALGPNTTVTICPSCHAQISTTTQHETSTKTHLFALLLCLIGCWPCAAIPYCTDTCQNTNHYCPNCKSFLGTYAP